MRKKECMYNKQIKNCSLKPCEPFKKKFNYITGDIFNQGDVARM